MGVTNFVPTPKFEDYKEQFKEHFIMERKNGIISVRLHTNGGPMLWNYPSHNAMGRVWHVIGSDPENEVLIVYGTPQLFAEVGPHESEIDEVDEKSPRDYIAMDMLFRDMTKLVENLIWDIDVPTIGVIPGPGFHTEMCLLCDITLCAENVWFYDGHFSINGVPGDGQGLTLQHILGTKRAAYMLYTGKEIDAKTALELGVVNEVLPADKLMPRAWELAELIMQKPRSIRRLTREVTKRPWKRVIMDDFQVHVALEDLGIQLEGLKHDPSFTERFKEALKKENS